MDSDGFRRCLYAVLAYMGIPTFFIHFKHDKHDPNYPNDHAAIPPKTIQFLKLPKSSSYPTFQPLDKSDNYYLIPTLQPYNLANRLYSP